MGIDKNNVFIAINLSKNVWIGLIQIQADLFNNQLMVGRCNLKNKSLYQ